MKTEYEATFLDIEPAEFNSVLKKAGAILKRPEFLQRRTTLDLPEVRKDESTWLRVRDEGDKITLTLKTVDGKGISGQKETAVDVSDFSEAVALLEAIGCVKKSYQESKREIWLLGNVEVSIDTWPFLEPYVEVEGPSEAEVRDASAKLGLDYGKAIFDTVNAIYKIKYGKRLDDLDKNILSDFRFGIDNPFLRR